MNNWVLKTCATLCLVLFVFGCGKESQTDNIPVGDPGVSASASKLDLTTDKYQLNTNGLDSATLTIVTRDSSNAAVGNVAVNLSASGGILSASQVTTNDTGKASVTLSPGPEKSNQVVSVTATAGSLSKVLPITLLGTTLSLTSSKTSLLSGVNDSTTLTVKALDANGNPIPNTDLTLTSEMGNNLTAGSTTASTVVVTTNSGGEATATFTALDAPGTDTITASGLGAQTDISLNITNAQFGFTAPAENSTIAVGDTTNLEVTWTDAAGNPVSGETLTFTTTSGTFGTGTSTTTTTDASGKAIVAYTASTTATGADINVTSGTESASLHLLVVSTNPSQLSLQASPTVLGPSVGGVNASSTITATVRDSNGQLVSGQTVVFNLQAGPGGGEYISPGTAVTDTGGTASVTFTSGSAVSAQNGVRVRATLLSDSTIYAETTLTIAQKATSIVLGSSNKIDKVNSNGLEIGYALPFSVLVVDINGNPIPNATVNLGLYPLFFYTGLDSTGWTGKYMNEDTNRNGILDPGEDGAHGWSNPTALRTDSTDEIWLDGSEGSLATVKLEGAAGTPNGKLDPGGVASIPDSVVTDKDGLAAFEIKYPKSFGNWVYVEIKASTQVSGDLSTSKIETPLDVMQGDTPFPNSPFGY